MIVERREHSSLVAMEQMVDSGTKSTMSELGEEDGKLQMRKAIEATNSHQLEGEQEPIGIEKKASTAVKLREVEGAIVERSEVKEGFGGENEECSAGRDFEQED